MSYILLVEDDEWLAETEAQALTDAGYTVRTVSNGFAAIDLIDDDIPGAIILDVLLAGTTAFSLLNELQSHSDTGEIPIILCTNIAEQLDAKRLADYGVRRILNKTTMHPDDLAVALRAVL